MKQRFWVEAAVFVLLAALGVGARLYFQHLPNFAPVAALALFAGFYFRSWLLAACLPLAIMAVSDWFIGGYNPLVMAVVYGALALPVGGRGFLRAQLEGCGHSTSKAFWGGACVAASACLSSLAFFLVSNFAWWATGGLGIYEPTPAGLVHCFTQALPFFRYTFAGDLFFTALLFGGYAALQLAAERLASKSGRLAEAGASL